MFDEDSAPRASSRQKSSNNKHKSTVVVPPMTSANKQKQQQQQQQQQQQKSSSARSTPTREQQQQQQVSSNATPSQLILHSNLRHASDSTPLTASRPHADANLSNIIKELNSTPQRQSAMYANVNLNPATKSAVGVDVLQSAKQQQQQQSEYLLLSVGRPGYARPTTNRAVQPVTRPPTRSLLTCNPLLDSLLLTTRSRVLVLSCSVANFDTLPPPLPPPAAYREKWPHSLYMYAVQCASDAMYYHTD